MKQLLKHWAKYAELNEGRYSKKYYTKSHIDPVQTDVGAVDAAGNTALLLSLLAHSDDYALPLVIAQKMTLTQKKIVNNTGQSALALAVQYETNADSKQDKEQWGKLVNLLQEDVPKKEAAQAVKK